MVGRVMEVGRHTYGHEHIRTVYDGAVLKIGSFCSIGGSLTVYLGGNHRTDWVSTYPFQLITKNCNNHPQSSKGDVIIGNDVWTGNNSIIMSGVTVGDGAVIGANSVVSSDVGPYEVWVGNPAVCKRKRFTEAQIQALLKIQWWDWSDEKIFSEAMLLSSEKIDEFIERNL